MSRTGKVLYGIRSYAVDFVCTTCRNEPFGMDGCRSFGYMGKPNDYKEKFKSYFIGVYFCFIVIWLMAIGMFSRNVEWCAIFMLISVSLIYALVIFLSNYLLYRYEKGE